jgi:hypothetical protein
MIRLGQTLAAIATAATIGVLAHPAAADWSGSNYSFTPLPGCQIFSNSATQTGPQIVANLSHSLRGGVNVIIEGDFYDGNRRVAGGQSQATTVGPNQVLGVYFTSTSRSQNLSSLVLRVRVISCTPA